MSTLEVNNYCPFETSANVIRKAAMVIFIIFIIAVCFSYESLVTLFLNYIEWMENHTFIGTVSFIIISSIANVLLIPVSLFTLSAGFVYCHVYGLFIGMFISSILVFIAECLGATLSFLNGRYLLRNIVKYYTSNSSKFVFIEKIIQKNGFRVVFLLRLTPLCPWNFLNILLGITSVTLKDYCLAHIAMIPKTIIFSFIGGTISQIYQVTQHKTHNNSLKILLILVPIIGTMIACFGIASISKMAKMEFDKLSHEIETDSIQDIETERLLETAPSSQSIDILS